MIATSEMKTVYWDGKQLQTKLWLKFVPCISPADGRQMKKNGVGLMRAEHCLEKKNATLFQDKGELQAMLEKVTNQTPNWKFENV